MKKIIFALCLGLTIGSATTGLAATSDFIQATFVKFNIQISDKEPVEVEAVVHEGVSYYSIREIASLLDKEVNYIDATKTIVIDTPTDIKIESSATEVEKEMPKYKTLDQINSRIESLNLIIYTLNFTLNEDISEERREKYLKQKEQVEAELAELKIRKEELEASK